MGTGPLRPGGRRGPGVAGPVNGRPSAQEAPGRATWPVPPPPRTAQAWHRRRDQPAATPTADDPLLAPGLRYALEALLAAAGEAPDPQTLNAAGSPGGPAFPRTWPPAPWPLHTAMWTTASRSGNCAPGRPDRPTGAAHRDGRAPEGATAEFFDGDEFDALFSQDLALDEYMLARLEIERNSALTPEQKRSALQEAEQALSPRAVRSAPKLWPTKVWRSRPPPSMPRAWMNARAIHSAAPSTWRGRPAAGPARPRTGRLERPTGPIPAGPGQHARPGTPAALARAALLPEEQLRLDAALAARSFARPLTRQRHSLQHFSAANLMQRNFPAKYIQPGRHSPEC